MDAATARPTRSCLPEARCWAPGPYGGTGPPRNLLGQSGENPGRAYDRRTMAAEGRTTADPPSHQGCAISSVRLRPPAQRGELRDRHEDGHRLHHLLWRLGPGVRVCSSAVLGGGIGPRAWILNAQVPGGYPRLDPDRHLAEIAAAEGLTGPGAGLMTAADVAAYTTGHDGGVTATVTMRPRCTRLGGGPRHRHPSAAPAGDGGSPGIPVPTGGCGRPGVPVPAGHGQYRRHAARRALRRRPRQRRRHGHRGQGPGPSGRRARLLGHPHGRRVRRRPRTGAGRRRTLRGPPVHLGREDRPRRAHRRTGRGPHGTVTRPGPAQTTLTGCRTTASNR